MLPDVAEINGQIAMLQGIKQTLTSAFALNYTNKYHSEIKDSYDHAVFKAMVSAALVAQETEQKVMAKLKEKKLLKQRPSDPAAMAM